MARDLLRAPNALRGLQIAALGFFLLPMAIKEGIGWAALLGVAMAVCLTAIWGGSHLPVSTPIRGLIWGTANDRTMTTLDC